MVLLIFNQNLNSLLKASTAFQSTSHGYPLFTTVQKLHMY